MELREIIYLKSGAVLSVKDNVEWALNTNKKLYSFSENEPTLPLMLLPILEIDYLDFINKLADFNVPEKLFSEFPFDILLKFPFENKRKWWAELAMNWLEEREMTEDLKNWAKKIPLDWMPQKLKHRFFKRFLTAH